jgi:hypothetical protein
MNADRTQGRTLQAKAKGSARPTRGTPSPGKAAVYAFDRPACDEVNQAFNHWLDEKLREMYRATQDEPVPQEILDLIQRMLRPH